MKQNDLLQILIPTYNRDVYLKKNIKLLNSYIKDLNIGDRVSILISDNASQDKTLGSIFELENEIESRLFVYKNEKNIGLEENAVKILSKATADYVMFLGDDDFIEKEYLRKVCEEISLKKVYCIIPSFRPTDMDGGFVDGGRDLDVDSGYYKAGFYTAARNLWRGHQLSGLTFYREGTLESYLERSYRNIYLFMYFVGYNSIRGNVLHYTKYPVRVTQPGENTKDWNYGRDGLVNERFKNSASLFKGKLVYRFIAECELIKKNNNTFLIRYFKKGYVDFKFFLNSVYRSKYLSTLGKVYFTFYSLFYFTKLIIRKVFKI